jgi:hypothetical protein
MAEEGTPPQPLVQDAKGRWVSPLERALPDVAPPPLSEGELLAACGIEPAADDPALLPSLPEHCAVDAHGSSYPPLEYCHNMGFEAAEIGAVARALPKGAASTQRALDSMLRVKSEEDDAAAVGQLLAAGASAAVGNFPLQPQLGAWETGGRTALHLACYKGATTAAAALLAAGADATQLDDCGNTAFGVACEGALGGEATSNPAGVAARKAAAALVAPRGDGPTEVPLPSAAEVKAKLQADKALAREIGPQRVLARRKARGELLRAELEWGVAVTATGAQPRRLLFSAARDCTWESHWYVDAARRAKAADGQLLAALPWPELKTAAEVQALPADEVAAERAAGGWKARLLAQQLAATTTSSMDQAVAAAAAPATTVIVGHSSGGTAALRLAERLHTPMPGLTLIVIGAGYSAQDYLCDAQARAQAHEAGVAPDPEMIIPPWDFTSMVANVGKVVVLHGADDDVILAEEAIKLERGLAQAAAAAATVADSRLGAGAAVAAAAGGGGGGVAAVAKVELEVVAAGLGHAMEKETPAVVLAAILRALGQ